MVKCKSLIMLNPISNTGGVFILYENLFNEKEPQYSKKNSGKNFIKL